MKSGVDSRSSDILSQEYEGLDAQAAEKFREALDNARIKSPDRYYHTLSTQSPMSLKNLKNDLKTTPTPQFQQISSDVQIRIDKNQAQLNLSILESKLEVQRSKIEKHPYLKEELTPKIHATSQELELVKEKVKALNDIVQNQDYCGTYQETLLRGGLSERTQELLSNKIEMLRKTRDPLLVTINGIDDQIQKLKAPTLTEKPENPPLLLLRDVTAKREMDAQKSKKSAPEINQPSQAHRKPGATK